MTQTTQRIRVLWHSEMPAGSELVSSQWRQAVKWETRVIFHVTDQIVPPSKKAKGRDVMTLHYCERMMDQKYTYLKVAKKSGYNTFTVNADKESHRKHILLCWPFMYRTFYSCMQTTLCCVQQKNNVTFPVCCTITDCQESQHPWKMSH